MNKYGLYFDGDIGEFLHSTRRSKRINSTDLSKAVGKSPAYISQIENGRNKNPDYETMYKVFKHLGIEEEKIEDYLLHFQIKSPEREAWEEEQAIKASMEPTDEDITYMERQADFYRQEDMREFHERKVDAVFNKYIDESSEDDLVYDMIKENIKTIVYVMDNIIEHDINNAFNLITGLGKTFDEITTNEKFYKFIVKLFSDKETRLHSLDEEGMLKVLNTLYEELNRIDREKTAFGKPRQRNIINKL
ncbi:helix-turn-helix domain-containing protein [Sutcliffiella sp. NC1]|uniref:helix-turn-helix domain-containing protein n=1 Tax=Sutcliffiella sp. NC1 TaxID=3004096 RepID=UPI0022DE4B57|nr:helix-turn-helix transcriptional regulator [Sutcliffiella sp. NC1]WBL16340.1 helix-turn-helix transcriptional regulator [Sutcliffiella sp. NC1]